MTGTVGPRLARAGAVGAAVLTAVAGLVAAVLLVGDDRDSAPAVSSSTVPTVSSTGTHTGIKTAPPTLRSEIDRVLEGLSLANVAFNAPKTLRVHGTAVIQLLLSGEQPIEQLQDQLTELGEKAFERSLDVRVTLERALERVPLGQLAMALDSVAHPARRLGAEQAKKAG